MDNNNNFSFLLSQLPQPNAKPLKYENAEDVKKTVDVFLKTEPSEASFKYKSTQAPLRKLEENRLGDVKSANDVFSWDMYKQPAGYVAPKPRNSNFLSRLDDTVKTIDFNNMTANGCDESSPLVTIHKRALSSPEDCNQTSAFTSAFVNSFTNPKRKKYVVVPNSASRYSSNQSSQEPSEQPTNITETQELPTDRKELLKFVSVVPIFLNCFKANSNNLLYIPTDQIHIEWRAIWGVSKNIHVIQQCRRL